jgi:fatty acid desaturase
MRRAELVRRIRNRRFEALVGLGVVIHFLGHNHWWRWLGLILGVVGLVLWWRAGPGWRDTGPE